MSTLLTAREADVNLIARMKAQLIADLTQIVRSTSGVIDLVYRNVRPTDFQNGTVTGRLNNPNALVANTYATDQWPNFTLTSTQALGIFGYAAIGANPQIDELTFIAGPVTLSITPLDVLYAEVDRVKAYIIDPIVWGPTEHVRIDVLAGAAVAQFAEQFAFEGIIVEPEKLVAKPRTLVSRPDGATAVPGHLG